MNSLTAQLEVCFCKDKKQVFDGERILWEDHAGPAVDGFSVISLSILFHIQEQKDLLPYFFSHILIVKGCHKLCVFSVCVYIHTYIYI